ncbi:50S ribosomal protein L22 [Candidatus Nasuia deltocephalinicola]|nr:50S ribosomal protein L22 [Candidatus Nasuia deltocephalinicola]
MFKIIFKKIKISHKKIRYLINKIRGFSLLNMLIYLEFLNKKSSLILKKILISCFYNFISNKFSNIKIVKISSEKGIILKRPYYRSKGIFNILNKRYSNIIIHFSNF